MMKAVTASAITPKAMKGRKSPMPAPVVCDCTVLISVRGPRAMMPAKITSEMPLPMPYSVISSPNHISITVPLVSVRMMARRVNHSRLVGSTLGVLFWKSTVSP